MRTWPAPCGWSPSRAATAPISKATLTAISNTRSAVRATTASEEATAIQWTLWGKQAENAAQYLGKGSHVNVVGRVQNNNYEQGRRDRLRAWPSPPRRSTTSTAKAEGEALRASRATAPEEGSPRRRRSRPQREGREGREGPQGRCAGATELDEHGDPIPF